MDKEDARYQKLEPLHERRKQVVRLHLRGACVMRIVALTGLSYPTARRAVDLFEAGGWPAIKPASRGRSAGEGRLPNADLKQAIGSKVPVRTKSRLRAAADEHMQFIAANRDRVRSYFQDPIVKYAA